MNSIKNYIQLRDNIATSGQPKRGQFQIIADAGYETVINLAMPDHAESIPEEGSIVTSLGMAYLHLPIPFDKPLPKQVKQFCQIMASIKDTKIWVHCIMNYRVSAVPVDELKHCIALSLKYHLIKHLPMLGV
ncbi:protein tyrosine phosphatase family protein [Endozoicomonas sp. SM1973]|uniref:Protein tyrosine phosphatase family protein n=1 Tax=Spartinivicinus marinus TaxID=2994442 RepID=A0A853HYE8_9GAMM|nr:protein tyrosine phosphatase family protein [Spartinivicinus marinus]MCX4026885.1 protein tyrosine phosphatase family protein [Spartinivicinus marinus]NYZ66770.1 protein tyrosine phosphatase family protein [Spartinivicinus marinus]